MITLNDYFDEIQCINLERRLDRWQECELEFKKHNLNVNKFKAVDGKNLNSIGFLNSGQVGTILSHKAVLEYAKENDLQNVLILEDDVEFQDNFNQLFGEWHTEIPDDWDIILFGGNHCGNNPWSGGSLTKCNEHVYKVTFSLALHCYAVRNTVYERLIYELTKMNDTADSLIANSHSSINCYIFRPHLAWQRASHSDLAGFFTDYVALRDDTALIEGRPFSELQLVRNDIRDKLDPTWRDIYDRQKEKLNNV